ncbi:MAG: hypothetical protein KZQ93_15805 [Candidatus Thiodiazotropha sp. (ex Monitilora ramsayi)]|nr:hypothetical protein [Candidatus Thiodiazotropha sp. (ex Monitilora ramsayi)]
MGKPQLAKALNLVLGAGYVMLGFEDANGNVPNFNYQAESSLQLNVSPETTKIQGEDTPTAEDLITISKSVSRSAKLTIKNITDEILAAFSLGTYGTYIQAATPVVDEACTFKKGAYIYFGKDASNPAGAKNVTAVTITDGTGTTTYTEGVGNDYILEADKGRAFIPLTSTIVDDSAGLVDYTPAAETRSRVTSGSLGAKTAWMIFEGDNANGENQTVDAPKVKLIPDGDFNLKDRDNPQAVSFTVEFETRTGYEQLYIDGEAA